jgi:hypothetical protein
MILRLAMHYRHMAKVTASPQITTEASDSRNEQEEDAHDAT